jgi:phosphoenolpyruvate phosphomutase / 2-hydroxyethylphosphonate cytidylyltransferase
MAKVYIGMTIDVLHHGHIHIIEEARKHGDVMIGLLTDAAVVDHKRLPYLSYEHRKKIVENISGVTEVVAQEDWDYAVNLRRYQPEYMIHGDDWLEGPLAPYRKKALEALAEYGGKLIQIPYTKGVSSSTMMDQLQAFGTTPDIRKATLRRLLKAKPLVRFIEAHSPISALIAENAKEESEGKIKTFDGFWSSSLTDSTEMGKPDIEALDISSRLSNVNSIFDVTTKPMIMDADTGGKAEHFEINVRSMERLGISAVIIEDKTGLKKNSLFGNDVVQTQDDIESFCDKIRAGKASLISSDFMIIARIESLILDNGMDNAVTRARAYVEAGVDGIMIHSRKKQPDEVFEFAKIFRSEYPDIPLVCVPTSYNYVLEEELAAHGFNIVIYANQLLRAAYPAMSNVAHEILRNGCSASVDDKLISIKEILELIPGTK